MFNTWWDKTLQPQKCTFWEKELKNNNSNNNNNNNNDNNKTILHFMTTFHNVALKTETSLKLQMCLSPLWKLKKPMVNVKT